MNSIISLVLITSCFVQDHVFHSNAFILTRHVIFVLTDSTPSVPPDPEKVSINYFQGVKWVQIIEYRT